MYFTLQKCLGSCHQYHHVSRAQSFKVSLGGCGLRQGLFSQLEANTDVLHLTCPEQTHIGIGELAQMDNILPCVLSVVCLIEWLGLIYWCLKPQGLKTKIFNHGLLKSGEIQGVKQQLTSGRYWMRPTLLGLKSLLLGSVRLCNLFRLARWVDVWIQTLSCQNSEQPCEACVTSVLTL